MKKSPPASAGGDPVIRPLIAADFEQVVQLDTKITSVSKPEYWHNLINRYHSQSHSQFFLVSARGPTVLGFIIGEIRAWEFGSPPCGWVFTIAVDPDLRLDGIGTALFDAICDRFRKSGVGKVRTMLARDAELEMSFFRSQGMMGGPFIQLEKDLDL